jgi:hypothetical protein
MNLEKNWNRRLLSWSVVLILISPYTAFVPLIVMSGTWWKNRKDTPWTGIHTSMSLLWLASFLAALIQRSLMSFVGSMGLFFLIGAAWFLQENIGEAGRIQALLAKIWQVGIVVGSWGLVEKALAYGVDMTWIGRWFWSPNFKPNPENYRIYATFGNPNVTGMWFAWLVLLSIYLWETEPTKRRRYLVGLVVFAGALIATGSKGATLGMLASLVVYAMVTKNKTVRIVLIGLFAGIAGLAFLSPEINHVIRSSRLDWWQKSLPFILQRPLTGWGLWGAMGTIGNIHSHNAWVSIVFFFGFPGLAYYLWWKGILYQELMRLHQSGSPLAILLIASHVFFVVHGIVDFTWMTPQGGALFFGLCGITVGWMKKEMRI